MYSLNQEMTSTTTPNYSPSSISLNSQSYVHQAQQLMYANCRARNKLLWAAINTVVFSVILYDLMDSCYERSYIVDYIELLLLCIFLLNTLYHTISYLLLFSTFRQVPLTERQKKLLGISPTDPKFPTITPQSKLAEDKDKLESRTSLNLSNSNWLSSSLFSQSPFTPSGSPQSGYMSTPSILNNSGIQASLANLSSTSWSPGQWSDTGSANLSMSTSWVYQPGSPSLESSNAPLINPDEPVTDEESLNRYLQQCEAYEKKQSTASPNVNSSPSNLSLLWNSSLNSSPNTDLASTANAVYHLAPLSLRESCVDLDINNAQKKWIGKISEDLPSMRDPSHCFAQDTSATGSPGFDAGTTTAINFNETMWRKEGVSLEVLSHWNKNLRQWLTMTVLDKISKEVDAVNNALQRFCASDDRIGTTGLERLKKTASMPQVAQHVPNLNSLLPFLEVTTYQDYLITRIKDLAQGGCMSNFKWSSGGDYNGKPWEEHLPTDCAVIMHLLASYLDVQLPPVLHRLDRRPFSAQFLSKPTNKPKPDKDLILIHQTRINPPHYVLFWRNEVLEIPQGCNNFLYTLLLFLHRLNTKEDGMLGRMNLGPSGLNILWVIGR